MNHFTFSASLASLASLTAAGYIWFLNPSRKINRVFTLYWFGIGFWAFFVGTQSRTIPMLSGFWWGWFLHLGCTFIPVLLFHAVSVLTNQTAPGPRMALKASYAITLLFNALNLSTMLFTGSTVYRDAYAYPKPAILYPFYFLLFVSLVVWSTLLMAKHLSALAPNDRKWLIWLLATHVLAYAGGMDNFLIMVDIRLPVLYPHGLYPIILYALVSSLAARKVFKTTS